MADENSHLCEQNRTQLIEIFEHSFAPENNSNVSVEEFLTNAQNHCDNVLIHKWISIIVPIIFAIIVLVGIAGNVLVLLVVILKQQMRNTTNVLMLVSFGVHFINWIKWVGVQDFLISFV